MRLLTVKDLEMIHIQIIDASGGSLGVRDIGRLESAIASIEQDIFGKKLYPTIFEQAAVLCRGIILDHPFVDGNKRTGVMSALIYLNFNGYDTSSLADKDLEDFAVKIAVENLDIKTISTWLKTHSKKPNSP